MIRRHAHAVLSHGGVRTHAAPDSAWAVSTVVPRRLVAYALPPDASPRARTCHLIAEARAGDNDVWLDESSRPTRQATGPCTGEAPPGNVLICPDGAVAAVVSPFPEAPRRPDAPSMQLGPPAQNNRFLRLDHRGKSEFGQHQLEFGHFDDLRTDLLHCPTP